MRISPPWSIRTQLLLLVMISVLPAMGIIIYSGIERRDLAIKETKESSLRFISTIAERQHVIEESTHQLLMVLAKIPALQNLDIKACNALFRQLLPQNPLYGNIFFVDKNGWVVASAVPTKPHNIAKRKYFRDIITKKYEFSTGEYVVGVSVGKPVFHYAVPVSDKRRSLKGIVVVALNLKNYDKVIAEANLPEKSNLALTDHQGIRLYRYPDNDKFAGQHDLPVMIKHMAGSSNEGIFLEAGVDGTRRFYAYKKFRLSKDLPPYLYMRLGITEEKALEGARYVLWRDLSILVFIFILALACAWFLGGFLIANSLNKLITVTNLFKRGERNITTGLPHNENELGQLAEAFDQMIAELNKHDSEQKKLEEVLQESEEKYRMMVENAREGIMIAQDRRLIFVNRATEGIMGYSKEILTSQPFADFIHPDDRNLVVTRHLDRLNGREIPPVYSFRIVCSNKMIKQVELNAAVINWKGRPATVSFISDITDRKQVEEILQANEVKFNQIFKLSPVAQTLSTLQEGIFLDVNEEFLRTTERTSEEVIGHTASEIGIWENAEQRNHILSVVREKGLVSNIELETQSKSGKVSHVLWSAGKIKINGQECLLASAIDITELRRTKEELQKSERRLNDIINFLPDATLAIDSEKKIIIWNKAIEKMTGIKAADMIGKGNYEYSIPFYGQRRRQLMNLIWENDQNLIEKYSHVNRDGESLISEAFCNALYDGRGAHVYAKASPLHDQGGNIIGAIESIRDITEDKRAEEAIQTEKSNLGAIFASSPVGMLVIDENTNIVMANATSEIIATGHHQDILNRQPGDAMGCVHSSKDPRGCGFSPDCRLCPLRNAIKSVISSSSSLRNKEMAIELVRNGNLNTVWLAVGAEPLIINNRRHVVIALNDITELKLMEKKFFEAQKMESLGVLSGGIAHDFNNILASLLGYTEMAAEEKDESVRKHCLEQVLLACERARDLVQQILAFSRHTESERKPFDMRLLIKESLNLISSTIPATIEIRQKITNKICPINADPTQMHQVLMNLCTNAVHAMGEKGGTLDISLSCEENMTSLPDLKTGCYVKLIVSDNGLGIDPAIRDRIFEPFFTTKKVGEGTGLGLSVVYGIINNHQGTITVSSEPNKGTTFIVYIPFADETKHEKEKQTLSTLAKRKGSECILFVDDDKSLAKLGPKMLSSLGYEVKAFTDSREALKTFCASPESFDLVITDMTMPHLTGKDLAQEIMKSRLDMPIILCTGYSEYMNEEKALQMGIKKLFRKPFTKNDLAKVVREILDKSGRK